MAIQANTKIMNKIEELLPMDQVVASEFYRDERVVELCDKLPYLSSIKKLLRQYKHQYLQYGIDTYAYSSGLIKLKSYVILNGEYRIDQIVVTEGLLQNETLVDIWNCYELKALQQFLIQSPSANSIFGFPGFDERNIEVNETEVELGGKCIGRFKIIQKSNSDIVYTERYMPIQRITEWDFKPKDIFSMVELEILYRYHDVPVFAQVLDSKGNSLLEGTRYSANNYDDAQVLMESVIGEVDAILDRITTIIREYPIKSQNHFVSSEEEKAPVKVFTKNAN